MIIYANQVLYDQYKADKLQDVQDGLQKIGDKKKAFLKGKPF